MVNLVNLLKFPIITATRESIRYPELENILHFNIVTNRALVSTGRHLNILIQIEFNLKKEIKPALKLKKHLNPG